LIVALAALAHIRISPQRDALATRPPQFQELPFDVQLISPAQAWEAWQHFRAEKLEARNTPSFITNRRQYQQLSYALYIAWGAAGLGAILVGLAAWPRKGKPDASRSR
jgi:hypothetical protein